jgi:hypothetical protein
MPRRYSEQARRERLLERIKNLEERRCKILFLPLGPAMLPKTKPGELMLAEVTAGLDGWTWSSYCAIADSIVQARKRASALNMASGITNEEAAILVGRAITGSYR